MGKLSKFTELVNKIATQSDAAKYEYENKAEIRKVIGTLDDSDWDDVEAFLLACIKCGNCEVMDLVLPITKIKKIKWKTHQDVFAKIIEAVTEQGQKPVKASDMYIIGDFYYFMEALAELMKSTNSIKTNTKPLYMLFKAAISSPDSRLVRLPRHFTGIFPWQQKDELQYALEVMDITYNMMTKYPKMRANEDYPDCITQTWEDIFGCYRLNVKAAGKCTDAVAKVFLLCADSKWEDGNDKRTHRHEMLITITQSYFLNHCMNSGIKDMLKPVFHKMLELKESDNEDVKDNVSSLIGAIGGKVSAELGGDSLVESTIQSFIDGSNPSAYANFNDMYAKCPDLFHKYMEEISQTMVDSDNTSLIMFFYHVGVNNAQKLTPKVVENIASYLKGDESERGKVFQVLQPIATNMPILVAPYDKDIIATMQKFKDWSGNGAEILMLIVDSEEKAKCYIKVMKDLIPKCDYVRAIHHVLNMHKIGEKYPYVLKPEEEFLKSLLKNPQLKSFAQPALEFIAGLSLTKVTNQAKDVKEDVKVLDSRVDKTEKKTEKVQTKVVATREKVGVVKKDVVKQGQRQKELEVVVKETTANVKELDAKTVSQVPKWTKDVGKLLNRVSPNDWRQLAKKLGYKDQDIKTWSTQKDPSSYLFTEWFSKYKGIKSTQTLLGHFETIKRSDVCMIVENAMKQADDVITNEDFKYSSPPPIFISYQWSQQTEAMLLQQHLEMAGFKCWLDIGQMGGGDKLFAKIDKGIRECKVVISCVSEKYAKSPNGNREVNLAVNVGKPIIPLLMGKMAWPPAGTMGPIFGEYIFIRFFAREGENVGDDRFWSPAKFQELLMQLRFQIVADRNVVDKMYKDWWIPDDIVVPKAPTVKTPKTTTKKEDTQSPEIFISYQWGSQQQVKTLYTNLTDSGYKCWLDIFIMGGGDSLYDEIYKGIRGCKLVLPCVTEKYLISSNCSREISLAHKVGKPIVAIALEKIKWPPAGLMGNVLKTLKCVEVYKSGTKSSTEWDQSELEKIMKSIKATMPK